MKNNEKEKIIAEALSTPRSRRRLAWVMTEPLMGGRNRPVPWEGYPDSPQGTLEVWDE
jgi:ribosomal protein S12 methylthiotransferase accessory factor YcaO